jgi:hypothetical protein
VKTSVHVILFQTALYGIYLGRTGVWRERGERKKTENVLCPVTV